MKTQLDETDVQILNLLQRDGRITNADLAKAVGLSAPSVLQRVRILEKSGIIKNYVTILDAERLGRKLIAFVNVSLSLHESQPIERFRKSVQEIPEITEVYNITENRALYEVPDPNVPAFTAWPDPPSGHRVRVYPMADVPADPKRFGRLFRCSTIMVNVFESVPEPRDPAKLSPHHHDDFEQLSLTFAGDYVHHIRTPWTVDMANWRDDDHAFVPSPAVTIIPPPTVHTSQAVHHMPHQLVDIFAPPRHDFSAKPGWVLNADEYPIPPA